MKKYSEIGGIPSKLKTPSELFEKVGKKWMCKVPFQADTFITKKYPFDVFYSTYDPETKKKRVGRIARFKDLTPEDKNKIYKAFSYKKKGEGKNINKLYFVDWNYEEQLKDDLEMRKWAGNDKLKKEYYQAYRYDRMDKLKEIEAKLLAKEKKSKKK